jgi:hypothetical protein
MASNYGPHFGVRRLDDNNATREGRYKTPASGNRLLLGTAVEMDFANAGYMKQSANASTLKTGVSGLLIYEDQFLANGPIGTINAPVRWDTTFNAYAQLGRYAVITSGAGIKVWFTNVPERVLPDGFTFPAISPVDGLGAAGIALGDYLGWNGTQWASIGAYTEAAPAGAWFQVVTLNDAAATLEATLLN